MHYRTADHKNIQFNGSTLDEVSDELAILADEAIEHVYGSVIRKVNVQGEVQQRYDVKVTVQLVRK